MRPPRGRPSLRLEIPGFGRRDPFRLRALERPEGSGRWQAQGDDGTPVPLHVASLTLAGAGHALLERALDWMALADPEAAQPSTPDVGVRLVVRRREARLLASLLRRHVDRLPQPPPWMAEFLRSLDEIDLLLRWEEA